MSVSTKMILTLTIISLLTGGILAYWDAFTAPKIEQHRLEELKNAISDVLPPYDHYEEMANSELTFYVGLEKESNKPVGIAFEAVGSGFQGKISMMVGVTPDFARITGLKVLEQIETPGLGTKIVEDPSKKGNPFWFSRQFRGVQTEPEIVYVKNKAPSAPNEIQAITGATISSRSVVNILNHVISRAKELYKQS